MGCILFVMVSRSSVWDNQEKLDNEFIAEYLFCCFGLLCTVPVLRMAHRKWKETKQQPDTAGPGNMLGCCLIYFHFRWGKLSTLTVDHFTIDLAHLCARARPRGEI